MFETTYTARAGAIMTPNPGQPRAAFLARLAFDRAGVPDDWRVTEVVSGEELALSIVAPVPEDDLDRRQTAATVEERAEEVESAAELLTLVDKVARYGEGTRATKDDVRLRLLAESVKNLLADFRRVRAASPSRSDLDSVEVRVASLETWSRRADRVLFPLRGVRWFRRLFSSGYAGAPGAE